MQTIMILGAYGTFGKRISEQLASHNLHLILVGRNHKKANQLLLSLQKEQPHGIYETAVFDVHSELAKQLKKHQPKVLIHTCGPFQHQDFGVLKACMTHKVNYIDLADGREFVNQIQCLDNDAKIAGISAITGASTVPALSSAVLDELQNLGMVSFDEIRYGITPGQKTERGLATVRAVLSYVGKPFTQYMTKRYGWQNLYLHRYPELGWRMMGNCDVPDSDLLPRFYKIKSLNFSAGMESKLLHVCIWLCSWLVRLGVPLNLAQNAAFWHKLSRKFDLLGSHDGGMHLVATGVRHNNEKTTYEWHLIAKDGDGPYVPTVPAVIIALRLVTETTTIPKGVIPCVGLISLSDYMSALSNHNIYHQFKQK